MKKLSIAIVLMISVFMGNAQTKNFIDQPYIDTTAKVDTLVIPDKIFINIVLHEEDSKGKTSIEELEVRMEKVLKGYQINTLEDLSVIDMSSNFKKYFLKEKEILKSKAYSLLLHNSEIASRVFVALEKEGISNVYLNKTEYSKMEELQFALKSKAISKAKKQAEYLTKPLGQQVGKAIYIMDRNIQHNKYRANELDAVVVGYGVENNKENFVDIEFQKIKIETTVSVKFQLK